jgi:hypothetical protein
MKPLPRPRPSRSSWPRSGQRHWARLSAPGSEQVGGAFGLASATVIEHTGRREGHLFLVVSDKGHFTEPDRVEMLINDRRPGETTHLARSRQRPGLLAAPSWHRA